MRLIIEAVLYAVALFGLVMGIITVTAIGPSSTPVEGMTNAQANVRAGVALYAAMPCFTLFAVALGLAGVIGAIGRLPQQR